MKNFSELLDTNQQLEVFLALQPVILNGPPWVSVTINDNTIVDDYLVDSLVAIVYIDILEPLDIEITMSRKEYSAELETALIIENLDVDNVELIPKYTHLATYTNDHNFSYPTDYLGFNGTWKFSTEEPFYRWLHRASGQGWLLEP